VPPTEPRRGDRQTFQVDFGHVFALSGESEAPTRETASTGQGALEEKKWARICRAVRDVRSTWANVIFVATALLGGFFCALYVSHRPDFFRPTAAWPRDPLYPRPSSATENSKIDMFYRADEHSPTFALRSVKLPDRGTSPFGQNVSLLNSGPFSAPIAPGANTANASGAVTSPNSDSPLAQLGGKAPGGDALSREFNRASADRARASEADAHRTVVVIRTAVSQAGKHGSAQAKGTNQRGLNAMTKRTLGRRASQSPRHPLQMTNAGQKRAAIAANRSVNSLGRQQAINSIRNLASNSGRGLGSGHARGGGGSRR
jgi:hypothetical protein